MRGEAGAGGGPGGGWPVSRSAARRTGAPRGGAPCLLPSCVLHTLVPQSFSEWLSKNVFYFLGACERPQTLNEGGLSLTHPSPACSHLHLQEQKSRREAGAAARSGKWPGLEPRCDLLPPETSWPLSRCPCHPCAGNAES